MRIRYKYNRKKDEDENEKLNFAKLILVSKFYKQ